MAADIGIDGLWLLMLELRLLAWLALGWLAVVLLAFSTRYGLVPVVVFGVGRRVRRWRRARVREAAVT